MHPQAEFHLRQTLKRAGQRRLGAFYTPLPLAAALVAAALDAGDPWPDRRLAVVDPAAGAGDFLLAASAELARRGMPAELTGLDVDASALDIARSRLPAEADLRCQDALAPAALAQTTFDLVIGNPPYGLKRSDGGNWKLAGSSVDSYAAFLAMGLALLRPDGVMAVVVADTWLTLRSHHSLRTLLLDHLVSVVRLPQGIFPATVGTALVIARRRPEAPGRLRAAGRTLRMADLTAVPADRVVESIPSALQDPPDSTPAVGRYDIDTDLIAALPGRPLFFGAPALADLIGARPAIVTCLDPWLLAPEPAGHDLPEGPALEAPVRTIVRHGTAVRWVRLEDVAEIRHGLSTGANARYVRIREPGRRTSGPGSLPAPSRSYPSLDPANLVAAARLACITDAEREHGLPDDEPHFVPFDKGSSSAAADAWLPNYLVPSPYVLDWSRSALADMRRNPGFSWKNWRYFFRPGLTFSVSGVYAPTFRLNSAGVFEAKGSCLFSRLDPLVLLGILCSRAARYLFKVFIKHTIDTSGHDVATFPLVLPSREQADEMRELVSSIMRAQRQDPRYDYARFEQVRLDALVAEAYGLSQEERQELDAWFARRYPRLDAAIRHRRQGSEKSGPIA